MPSCLRRRDNVVRDHVGVCRQPLGLDTQRVAKQQPREKTSQSPANDDIPTTLINPRAGRSIITEVEEDRAIGQTQTKLGDMADVECSRIVDDDHDSFQDIDGDPEGIALAQRSSPQNLGGEVPVPPDPEVRALATTARSTSITRDRPTWYSRHDMSDMSLWRNGLVTDKPTNEMQLLAKRLADGVLAFTTMHCPSRLPCRETDLADITGSGT